MNGGTITLEVMAAIGGVWKRYGSAADVECETV